MNNTRIEFNKKSFRMNLIKNLGMECVNCGGYAEIYHHIIPLAVGGTNNIKNIVPLCEKCHNKVHNRKSLSIKKLQREGIEAMPVNEDGVKVSLKTGRPTGRPKAEYPNNWEKEYRVWKDGTQTAKLTMENLGLKRTTFYKLVKQYEEVINKGND